MVEWSTRLLKGAPTTVPIGPQMGDLGLPDAEIQQIQRLDTALQRAQAGVEGARTTQRREELQKIVDELTRQREQFWKAPKPVRPRLMPRVRLARKPVGLRADLERQTEHYEAIRKKIGEVRKAQEDFRKEAAIAPERLGPPGTEEFPARDGAGLAKAA